MKSPGRSAFLLPEQSREFFISSFSAATDPPLHHGSLKMGGGGVHPMGSGPEIGFEHFSTVGTSLGSGSVDMAEGV